MRPINLAELSTLSSPLCFSELKSCTLLNILINCFISLKRIQQLVVAGGQGILVLSAKDGRKLGIHVVGLLAGFLDE